MVREKLWTLIGLIVVASMVLTACQPEPQTIVQTVVVKEPGTEKTIVITTTPPPPPPVEKAKRPNVIRFNSLTGDVPTLDPNLASDSSSIQIVEETFIGLTRLDEASNLHPGMATKWDISPDGKTYTFHLRNDVPWVKWGGTQVVKVQDCEGKDRLVTANDFAYGLLRTLKPETASPYAYLLAFAVEGAADYNAGVFTDTSKVGVKVVDDWTLEVKFLEDVAYNANIIGLWVAMPVPRWVIEGDDCTEARGDRWTEPGFFQSYGPFTLKEWVHDSTMTIVKNPFWVGDEWTPQPKIDEVTGVMVDDPVGLAEYEAGNQEIARVPLADMDRIKTDPAFSKELVIAPTLNTYYYGFNTKAKFVDDARVRRALSMALNRQSLIDNVTKGNQEPAQWLARPGLAGAPTMKDHPDLGVKYDPEGAKKLLDEYMAEKGLTVNDVELTLMFNTSAGHQTIAESIQQMWKDVLGLDVKLTNQEWKVFLTTIKSADAPQIFRSGWGADYPDANNFTREVVAVGGNDNPAKGGEPIGGLQWKNDRFEELVKAAATEKDPQKRVEMYAEAEQILCYEDAAIIPIYWYTRVTLTKPWVKRTFSATGNERFEHWEVLQD